MAPSRGVTHDVECITGAGGEGRTVLACDRRVAMRDVVRTIVGAFVPCALGARAGPPKPFAARREDGP
jgi:hypothetical protein